LVERFEEEKIVRMYREGPILIRKTSIDARYDYKEAADAWQTCGRAEPHTDR